MLRAIPQLKDVWTPTIVVATVVVAGLVGARLATMPESRQLGISLLMVFVTVTVCLLHRGGVALVTCSAFGVATLLLAMTRLRLSSEVALSDVALLGGASLVLFQLMISQRGYLPPSFRLFLVGVVMLLTGAAIATIFATNVEESMIRLIKFSIAALVLPVIIAVWMPSEQVVLRIVKLWVVSATFSAAVGILMGPPEYSNRIIGLASHPNTLALCAVLALGPVVAMTRSTSRREAIVACVALGILATAIVMSGSRAGFLGMMSVFGFLLITPLRRRALTLGAFGATCAALAVIGGYISLPEDNAIARLISREGSASAASALQSDASRIQKYADAFAQIQEMPLVGIGLQSARSAHNVYLQLFASSGALGLIGFLIAAYSVVRLVRPYLTFRMSHSNVAPAELMLVGLISSYVGMLVLIAFQNSLWERLMWIIPALVLTLADRVGEAGNGDLVEIEPC